MRQIQGSYRVKNPVLKTLYAEAKRLIGKVGTFRIVHVPREKNKHADRLVNVALNRAEADPNEVSVYLAVGDLDAAQAFAASDELKDAMQEVGVTGPPEMLWMTPIREEVVWDRQLPAMVVSHHVADFDAWLEKQGERTYPHEPERHDVWKFWREER